MNTMRVNSRRPNTRAGKYYKHIVCIALGLLLIGCDGVGQVRLDYDVDPIVDGSWYQPPVSTTWHWQLTDTDDDDDSVDIDTSNPKGVELYDIDLFDTTVEQIAELQDEDGANVKVICYFSAGTYEDWRIDSHQFPREALGNILDEWDEKWLDIRNGQVQLIMQNRLDLAVSKGCDGVEPDNMDGYVEENDSGFDFTAYDQIAYNRFIANEAHKRQLSVGLKNDLDQIDDLKDYYDFAVNEQCFEYSAYHEECDLLEPFITDGKPVFHVEYEDNVDDALTKFDEICDDSLDFRFSTLILPLELDGSFRVSCIPD